MLLGQEPTLSWLQINPDCESTSDCPDNPYHSHHHFHRHHHQNRACCHHCGSSSSSSCHSSSSQFHSKQPHPHHQTAMQPTLTKRVVTSRSVWLILAILSPITCSLVSATELSQTTRPPSQQDSSTVTASMGTWSRVVSPYEQLRHRLHQFQQNGALSNHAHHHGHHHHHRQHNRRMSLYKSHHYYQSGEQPAKWHRSHPLSQYSHPASASSTSTSSSNSSGVTLAPLSPLSPFLLLQQLVRQQQTSSRYRHPYYYYHYDSDHQQNSTELNPVRSQSSRRWSSARHLLTDSSPTPLTKTIYQLSWIKSDDQLPICEQSQVCNKVDTYSTPWIEKQCQCPSGSNPCSQSLTGNDGHTVVEKNRQYKLCEPVRKLPKCRYFRDITWTITTTSAKSEQDLNSLLSTASDHQFHNQHHNSQQDQQQQGQYNSAENITRQEVKCVCPPNSVAYIFKHQVYKAPDGQLGYRYHFACSPETKLRCKRKEPCRLFTARKRPRVEEVTTNTLCQCGNGYSCPSNHRHLSVLVGTVYPLDNIRTYSGYCYPDNSQHSQSMESNSESLPFEQTVPNNRKDDYLQSAELNGKSITRHNGTTNALKKNDNPQENKYLLSLLRR